MALVYSTISFNSAGPVMCDGPAEIFVSAPSQSCRDMPKKFRQFSATGEEIFLYLLSRPTGLYFPIEAGFHFSYFFPLPNPSENFRDVIIWYYFIRLFKGYYERNYMLESSRNDGYSDFDICISS
jgi:hypothetical protein